MHILDFFYSVEKECVQVMGGVCVVIERADFILIDYWQVWVSFQQFLLHFDPFFYQLVD